MYLDPDMVVFDSLEALRAAAVCSRLTASRSRRTGSRRRPTTNCGPTETELLRSGVFNLGFIARDRRGAARSSLVAGPVAARLHHRSRDGLLRRPALDRRSAGVVGSDDRARPRVQRRVLECRRATAARRRQPHARGRPGAALRALLGLRPRRAAHAVAQHGRHAARAAQRASRLAPNSRRGTRRTRAQRSPRSREARVRLRRTRRTVSASTGEAATVYRDALKSAEHHGLAEPPNPYADGDAFVAWLRSPAIGRPPRVSRYLEVDLDRPSRPEGGVPEPAAIPKDSSNGCGSTA